MSSISFPIKDLTRRRKQTLLTIFGLTIATASTLFLIIFGSNLGFEVSFLSRDGRLTSGFFIIFSQFILIVSILNIITGPIITSFLVHLSMSERIRDIGIMKACGSIGSNISAYFLTELSLIVFASTTAGIFLGIFIYYISTIALTVLGFFISQNINLGTVLGVYIITIIFAHIFGALPILKATKAKPIEVLSSVYRQGMTVNRGTIIPKKFGYTFKIVYRNLVRRKSTSVQMIFCLAIVLTLTTVTIAGGLIAEQTTVSYVERAIGKNTIIVGHPNVTQKYISLLSKFFQEQKLGQIDYLNADFLIPDSLVLKLSGISGISKVDPRLILEHSVQEVPGVILDPVEQTEAIIIGGTRSEEALILGVESDKVVNDWEVFGRELNENDRDVTMIGDSLAVNMFVDAQNQSIKIFEQSGKDGTQWSYGIVGICVDPLNNGKVVYLPLTTLFEDVGVVGYNLLFIDIDASERSPALVDINNEVSGENLSVIELESTIDKYTNFLESVWSLVMFLPIYSIVTAALCLLSYLMLSISCQQHELGIMRALGARPRKIRRIVFYQGLLTSLISCTIGVTVGLFITSTFLIPDLVVTQYTFISVSAWLLFTVGFLCIFSLYPAIIASKKKIVDIIYTI